jgi:hypothetical protein
MPELNVEEVALAYEIAVGSLPTWKVQSMLETERPWVSTETRVEISKMVNDLRYPDINEGDRVGFYHWISGLYYEGIVVRVQYEVGRVSVSTNNGMFYMPDTSCELLSEL